MKIIFKLFCAIQVVSLVAAQSDHNANWSCDSGWVAFKDEKCFKILDSTTRTYADAMSRCTAFTDGATLPIIHSNDEQNFLSNYLFNTSKMVDNFWIAAQFVNNSFRWMDKSDFRYTNWDSRGPRRRANYCVQMQFDETESGKWFDDPCEKKYALVCQKMQTWSLARLQQSLLDTRKEMRDANVEANKKIDEQKQEIEVLKQNQIPIGFIYSQLPNEKSPIAIWPSMNWTDVSSTYAGVFFRVEGGGSEPFGQTQSENDRRVIRMETTRDSAASIYENITVDAVNAVGGQSTKASGWIYTSFNAKELLYTLNLRLVTSTGEIRPRNMAIRVWKRTG